MSDQIVGRVAFGPSGLGSVGSKVAAAILESDRRYIERLALCADHRDKATGRCVVCQAEERTRQEVRVKHAQLHAAIRAYLRAHDDWQARRGNAQALHRAERELRELVRE